MKTMNNMVKKMTKSIITAGTFACAMAFGFTACSDELETGNTADSAPAQTGDYSQYEPYGLTYQNFESEGDVQILTVGPATVAELVGDKMAMLNTSIYVNDDAQGVQTRAASNGIPEFSAKYVDESNIIHPAVIHLTDPYGYDNGNYVGGTGKWINIPTMKDILSSMPHFKFIMADCCHFMCLESLYELRDIADYVIGSPAEIPGLGAPYEEIVPALFESNTFYTSIVEKYHAYIEGNLPLSVVKMSEMERVAQATANALQSIRATLCGQYPDLTGMIH